MWHKWYCRQGLLTATVIRYIDFDEQYLRSAQLPINLDRLPTNSVISCQSARPVRVRYVFWFEIRLRTCALADKSCGFGVVGCHRDHTLCRFCLRYPGATLSDIERRRRREPRASRCSLGGTAAAWISERISGGISHAAGWQAG